MKTRIITSIVSFSLIMCVLIGATGCGNSNNTASPTTAPAVATTAPSVATTAPAAATDALVEEIEEELPPITLTVFGLVTGAYPSGVQTDQIAEEIARDRKSVV